jgi:O-acetyl-ADP-ribose deacetylase (regulator of RNase III)
MKYVSADITTAPETIIMHGCNMQGKMNSGVAKALREKFPDIYNDYLRALNSGNFPLGDFVATVTGHKLIVNLLTQEDYGYDGKEYADLQAIYDSVGAFLEDASYSRRTMEGVKIATPKIGCGRGGLDWTSIKQLLAKFEQTYGVEFTVYDIEDEYSK